MSAGLNLNNVLCDGCDGVVVVHIFIFDVTIPCAKLKERRFSGLEKEGEEERQW
jgi:hypothetical protein